jgi:hypothetical protein
MRDLVGAISGRRQEGTRPPAATGAEDTAAPGARWSSCRDFEEVARWMRVN